MNVLPKLFSTSTGLSSSQKFLCAASAWWEFASAADRQRLQATVTSGVRSGLYDFGIPTVAELVDSADETLFKRVITNPNHVPYQLLLQRSTTTHNLRLRRHDTTLPDKKVLQVSLLDFTNTI